LLTLGHILLEAGADRRVGPAGGKEQRDQLGVVGQQPPEPRGQLRQDQIGGAAARAGQQLAQLREEAPLLGMARTRASLPSK
jgi:hypothetical protein